MIGTLIALAMAQATVPATPVANADDSKIKCKTSPVLGSRTKFKRECRTRAEWRLQEEDRKQLSRDMSNSYYLKAD